MMANVMRLTRGGSLTFVSNLSTAAATACYLTSHTSFKVNLEKLYQVFNHLA